MEIIPPIIGVCGPAHVGKDTFAKKIAELSRYRIRRFAETLKETAMHWFNWPAEMVYGNRKEQVDEDLGFSPRIFMQKCGTDFARNMLHEDIWVKIFQKRYGTRAIVIPDVRFENEAKWVRSHHGILVHVHRANFESPIIGAGVHASEVGIAPITQDWHTPECKTVDDVHAAAVDFHREYFCAHLDDQE